MSIKTYLNKIINPIFFYFFFTALILIRLTEFIVDIVYGDGDGRISTPIIEFPLDIIYLNLILLSSISFQYILKTISVKKIIVISFAISIFINLFSLKEGHNWGGDFSVYLMQAKGLVEGNIKEVEMGQLFNAQNSAYNNGPVFYPWGYPMLLAGIYAIFGFNLLAFKVFTFIFFYLTLLILYFQFKYVLNDYIKLFIAFFAFSPLFYEYKEAVLSDMPFMFFCISALFLIKNHIADNQRNSEKPWINLLIGLIISCSFFIRSIGIVLLPTLFICQMIVLINMSKHNLKIEYKRLFIFSLPYLTFFSLAALSVLVFGNSNKSYFSVMDIQWLYPSIMYNINWYINMPAEFFEIKPTYPIGILIWEISLPFLFLGIVKSFKKDYPYIIFCFFCLSVIILAQFQAGIRYFFPILPFILYFIIIGLQFFSSLIMQKIKIYKIDLAHIFMFSMLLFSTNTLISVYIQDEKKENYIIKGPFDKKGSEMLEFVSQHTQKSDVFIFYKPMVLAMLTERRNSFVVSEVDQIVDGRADYLIMEKGKRNDLFPSSEFLDKIKQHLKVIFENEEYVIYKIDISKG